MATDQDQFYRELAEHNLEGLWVAAPDALSAEPRPLARPYLWRWETLYRLTNDAGRLVTLEREGERRAVALVNPGLTGRLATSDTLYAAIQLIHPGELAPPHRHTPSAIRFILQGSGSSTTVEGEKISMEVGDLILTPTWTWHEHKNEGSEAVLWLDGLDLPLVRSLAMVFFQGYPEDNLPETKPQDYTSRAYAHGALRPLASHEADTASGSLLVYRWEAVQGHLESMAEVDDNAYDGVAVAYINPHTGGSALPTLACTMQMLRAHEHTQAHRHASSAVYQVFRGHGSSVTDGQRFDWGPGDCFVVPSWCWHEHANASGAEPAYLFSFNDSPVMRAFGLYGETPHPDGHQAVERVFQG